MGMSLSFCGRLVAGREWSGGIPRDFSEGFAGLLHRLFRRQAGR